MSEEIVVLDCLDSEELAEARERELNISHDLAFSRMRYVKSAVERGAYENVKNENVQWRDEVVAACLAKKSIPPWLELPARPELRFESTRVQVTNETTLGAALRLIELGLRPLVLNFANGISPGGGFLTGATAQEESLCRCSSLYWTLVGEPMYLHHTNQHELESTNWAIVSPKVPFLCNDSQQPFDKPILIDVITCAAPYAFSVGQPRSRELLRDRIQRVLHIAAVHNYESLVLGAWGCGAFGNVPADTAEDFKAAIHGSFKRQFSDIVFAIADWSSQRKFLGSFRDAFRIN